MSNVWRRVCRSIRSSKFQVVSIIIICFVILLYTTNDSPTETSEDLRIKINKRQQQNQQLFTRSKTTKNNITSNAKSINPYPFRVVIAPKPCTNEDVVFIVHSAVQYFDRRMLMRYTWLNKNNLQKTLALKVKIVFVTGMTNNTNVLTKLSYEQEFYQDILQSDFTDAYLNNTYKAISFLRWVSSKQGCPNASLIVKVDDDALMHSVQLPRFNETVHQILNKHRENVYMGKLISTHVNRDNSSKWFVSYELWPYKRYPIWFQGLAYMMTPKLAAKLPSLALNTAYMFTDDVYVGVLVSKIKDVDLIIDNSIVLSQGWCSVLPRAQY
ncbi:hypothetical protein EB796_022116 [Bugula neritina]|uniref:Hexosyltransferase n=1 Tax=Bugula neritina TaxID=10212 RepID=A0A7J7J096_BUGNE|nr:hypothetical protein EB796_022116 [Bugula neritina]